MRGSFFLLLFPLTTAGSLNVTGCLGGNVLFNGVTLCNSAAANTSSTKRYHQDKQHLKVIKLEKDDANRFCSGGENITLVLNNDCETPITKAPSRGENVTLKCDDDKYKTFNQYLCKEEEFTCKEVPTMLINVQSEQDYGTYWCGFNVSGHRVLVKRIWFQNVTNVTEEREFRLGGTVTYTCNYSGSSGNKDICKGDLRACQRVLNSSSPTGTRFSLNHIKNTETLNITLKDLIESDAENYWCFTESSDKTRIIHHKLSLKVDVSQTMEDNIPWFHIAISFVVFMVLSLLLLALWKCLPTKRHKQEDAHVYEELQQRPLPPISRATAFSSSMHGPAALHCSTVDYQANASELHAIVSSNTTDYSLLQPAPSAPDILYPTKSIDQEQQPPKLLQSILPIQHNQA